MYETEVKLDCLKAARHFTNATHFPLSYADHADETHARQHIKHHTNTMHCILQHTKAAYQNYCVSRFPITLQRLKQHMNTVLLTLQHMGLPAMIHM